MMLGLEIEAMVSNRDIGFVRIGQEAQIKIEAFDFTRYGLVHGRVEGVSRDAIVRGTSDRDADKRGAPATPRAAAISEVRISPSPHASRSTARRSTSKASPFR